MHPAILAAWQTFNTPIEGMVPFMYLDTKGLVTIGMGNLIDPISVAVTLPFKKRGKTGPANAGKPATRAEIERLRDQAG